MVNVLIGVVALVVLIGGGIFVTQSGDKPETVAVGVADEMKKGSSDTTDSASTMNDNEMTKSKDGDAMMKGDEMAPATAPQMGDEMMKDDMMKDDMKKEDMMKNDADDSMMKKTTDAVTAKSGSYIPYDAGQVAGAATAGNAVLFFRASWCPSCRALDGDIKAELANIPAGLTVFDVDYDANTALKQKYGVTTQHTLVQVAADGTLIKKWSGGSTLASVVEQVQ